MYTRFSVQICAEIVLKRSKKPVLRTFRFERFVLKMCYALYPPILLYFTEYLSVLYQIDVNSLSVVVAFLQRFSLPFHFPLESFFLSFIFFSIVFSDGKVSFSQYLLTQDKVKLLKGKSTVAEESVFQFIPSIRMRNCESPSYQNFLPFDEELDEKLELAYEVRMHGERISTCFYIFTRGSISEEKLDAKVQSIIYSFNLNTDYVKMRYDALEDAFLNMIGGEYFTRVHKIKGEKNVLLLEVGGRTTYISVIVLKGSPDYASLDPGCMDTFVNSIQNLGVDVSFVVPFRFVKTSDCEQMLKKDLRVRIKVNGKIPVKYLEASPYLVVRGSSLESVKNHAKRVYVAASAAWSGVKERISVDFLNSDLTLKFLHHIICRRLLPEREIFSVQNLGIYLRIPKQSVGRIVNTPVMIPSRETKGPASENGRVLLGKTTLNGRSLPVWMDYDDFSKHLFIFGDSNQKTCFLLSLLQKFSKPWVVFDFNGDFGKLKEFCNETVSFFTPNSNSEPLRINLFDPKEKSPEEHAIFLVNVFKKIFEKDFDFAEKPLSRILSHFCNMDRCKQGLVELNKAFDEILKWKNSQKPSVIREFAAMVHRIQHGVMGKEVFNSGESNLDLRKLTDEYLVINLTTIISEADISEVKFLLTYILMLLFNNLTKHKNEITHITIINCPKNGSELINFLIKKFFNKSTPLNIVEGLILAASHTQDIKDIYDLDSCYQIIFNNVKEAENSSEMVEIKSEKLKNPDEKALMIIPGAENPVILYPDYDHRFATKEKTSSQFHEDHIKKNLKTLATSKKPKAEIRDDIDSDKSYSLSKDNFITADQLFNGFQSPSHISPKLSYNLSREQITAFVDKISHMLESEVYLTDIYISRLTGIPHKIVNKIIREALDPDLEIQRIFVPVVGNKANIPLYYSKFGPKYESVQDKYLKDNLEELCFKRSINWTVKRDPETGADGKIDSHVLKLITHIPEDDELKGVFQKLFLKSNQVAVLFLYDKDLEEVERLNRQWRLPLIMGCLSNLNAFLTEIMEAPNKKIPRKPYTLESDFKELISWLKTET